MPAKKTEVTCYDVTIQWDDEDTIAVHQVYADTEDEARSNVSDVVSGLVDHEFIEHPNAPKFKILTVSEPYSPNVPVWALPSPRPMEKAMCYQVDVMWQGSDGSDQTETYPILAINEFDAERRTYTFLSSLNHAKNVFGLDLPVNFPPEGQCIGVVVTSSALESEFPLSRLAKRNAT